MHSTIYDRTPSRCELDDVLQQLDIRDDGNCWMDGSVDPCLKQPFYGTPSLFCALEEESDACDPFVYDPLMFTPSSSAPSSKPPTPSGGSFLCLADRDKPLPTLPQYSPTPSPPSTPRSSRSYMSTPPSSPRASLAHSGAQPLPRSRPPSANMSSTRSLYTHAAFPSISSTLSLLEERETEFEKRSGVIVTEDGVQPPPTTAPSSRNSSESTIIAHAARRSVSADPLMVSNGKGSDGIPMRKPRPTLNLTTSKSSLQLQELAELAQIPASPILAAPYTSSPTAITPPITSPIDTPSPRTVRHKGSFASLSPPVSSPLASSSFLLPPIEVEPPSRWSMDSVSRPTQVAEPSSSPKPRKRGRFMSLITRARTGSVSKPQPRSSSMSHDEFGLASPNESSFSHNSTNSTSSLTSQGRYSNCPAPPPMATSPSTVSTTSSSSNLPTPADSQCDINADPFCPASPTFLPSSYLPDPSPIYDEVDGRTSPPPEPTLPAPSPSVPTPSLFAPARSQSSIPFLSAALSKTKLRRRKKKLVISCIASADLGHPQSEGRAQLEAQRRERDAKKRCESILKWCESFGPVRRVDRKPDGSLHVHWKDWEVADTVCRVSGQVTIKGVGRVSLAWRYVN